MDPPVPLANITDPQQPFWMDFSLLFKVFIPVNQFVRVLSGAHVFSVTFLTCELLKGV
jgi:hypothetical protein